MPSLAQLSNQVEKFVLKTDQAPDFWQFLNGLRGDDLLVELIVNEFDARSTRTEVRFERDRLLCMGNGEPVGPDGWERLSYIKGAGYEVAAKRGMFGVKNHGLKACFTLGNNIILSSAGQQILQTLFRDGEDKPPYPSVRVPPRNDPDSPAHGTRIEVPYRRSSFSVPHGEAISFAAVTDEQIEQIFLEAVADLPKRLLGAMRPGMLETYELVLSHHKLGTRTFAFKAGRVRREYKLVSYFRECSEVSADGEKLVEREQACLAVSTERAPGKARFFQAAEYASANRRLFSRNGLLVEVAWDVDAAGKLKGGTGRLRYPVGYPGKDSASVSGTAAHYSGAFVSDTERHGLAPQSSQWNDAIVKACDSLLADVLARFLIPRHGPSALALIGDITEERLLAIADDLMARRAFPAIDSRGKATAHKKGALLVIPVYVGTEDKWSPELAKIAPPALPILDPRTPPALIQLLASGDCTGWDSDHLRFDGEDVLDRLERAEAERFPWRSEAERAATLSDALTAKMHLDALRPFLASSPPGSRPPGAQVHLPDSEGSLHPLSNLKRGASIPSDLLLDIPPTIHPLLRGHPVFKFEGWHLESYSLRNLLRGGDLAERPMAVRKRFFTWLASHPDELARDDWPAVKNLPLWPALDGSMYAFEDLCAPEDKVSKVLDGHIAKPTREVRLLCRRLAGGRVSLRLREEVRPAEVQSYYNETASQFPIGLTLNEQERSEFRRFEASLETLAGARRATGALRMLRDKAVAVSQAGEIRAASSMVRAKGEVTRLALQPRDLIDRDAVELDAVFPPARMPTPRMALDALLKDPENETAILPRLTVITAAGDAEISAELRHIPCIPYLGHFECPDRLAFRGNLGELWGGWKLQISGEGLADNVQELYRKAGVIRGIPTSETCRAYFQWINLQPPETATRHIDCIVRHLHHPQGVGAWLMQPPELKCIPVEHGGGVEMLSLSAARKVAVVDDLPTLAEAVRVDKFNPKLRLAIHSVPGVRTPIVSELRHWDLPTLSSLATTPTNPMGRDQRSAPESAIETVHELASPAAARVFRKQLQDFDVSSTWVEPQFQRRLLAIRRVVLAGDLTVQFKVRGRHYRSARDWVVLPNEIWLDEGGDPDDLLMEAIADIVFLKPRVRWLAPVLKRALRQRPRDFSTVRTDSYDNDEHDDASKDNEKPGESSKQHPGSEPDPNRNIPKPGKLYSGAGGSRGSKSKGNSRSKVDAEDVQRRQLKKEHYASHCQIELARRLPTDLAPTGSYAEHAENRIRMLEAHHPDKASVSGARHAGNLLILSKVNHDRIGTRVSRLDVTNALRDRWKPHVIFKPDGSIWLEGGIAEAIDRVSDERIPIFFTTWHRDYWLKMAPKPAE